MSVMLPKDFGKEWMGHVDFDIQPESSEHYGDYLAKFNSTHQAQLAEGGFHQHGDSIWQGNGKYSDAKYSVGGYPRRIAPGLSEPEGFTERTEHGLLVHTTWQPWSRSHAGLDMDTPPGQEHGNGAYSPTAAIKVIHDPKVHGHSAPLNFEKKAWEPQSFHDDGDYSHRLEVGPLTPSMHQKALRDISQLKPVPKGEHDLNEHWLLYRHGRYLDHAGPVPKGFDPNNYEEDGHHFGR